jgi:hypothetical protein
MSMRDDGFLLRCLRQIEDPAFAGFFLGKGFRERDGQQR